MIAVFLHQLSSRSFERQASFFRIPGRSFYRPRRPRDFSTWTPRDCGAPPRLFSLPLGTRSSRGPEVRLIWILIIWNLILDITANKWKLFYTCLPENISISNLCGNTRECLWKADSQILAAFFLTCIFLRLPLTFSDVFEIFNQL